MPNKHNTDRRQHISKLKFEVQNWPEHEAWRRRLGSRTLWIADAALAQWQSSVPRGQARYPGIAIETCRMLRAAFKMTLRHTEGLMGSILAVAMGAIGLSERQPAIDHGGVTHNLA